MNAIDHYILFRERIINAMNSPLTKFEKTSLLYMVLDDVTRELTILESKEVANG